MSKPPLKLDLCDKKILYYLVDNYMMPRKRLASLLKISPQKLQYKIKRLNGELVDPTIIFDYPRLGIDSHLLFIKGNIDESLINELLNHPALYFFYQIAGSYSYIVNLVSEDVNTFCKKYFPNNFVDVHKITSYIPGKFNTFELDINIPSSIFDYSSVSLDAKDYKILTFLSKNPDMNKTRLAKISHIGRKTLDKRIKKMLESGIIKKFRYSCNIYRFGITVNLMIIKSTASKKSAVLQTIKESNYDGFTYESYGVLLHQHLVTDQQKIMSFVGLIRKLGVEVEVLQKTNIYSVHCIPEVVIKRFESLSE